MVKNLPAMQETQIQFLGWEDPVEEKWQPTPVFLPGEFHGQRSLVAYSPWGVDMTKSQTRHSDYDYYYSYFLCVGWTVSLSRPLKS